MRPQRCAYPVAKISVLRPPLGGAGYTDDHSCARKALYHMKHSSSSSVACKWRIDAGAVSLHLQLCCTLDAWRGA